MDLIEINRKLIGEVTPMGNSSVDKQRILNLNAQMELTFYFVQQLIEISKLSNDGQYSVSQAGLKAKTYLEFIETEIKTAKL